MSQVILLRTSNASVSTEDAAALVSSTHESRVLHRSGDSMLAEIDPGELSDLKARLTGWIVSSQGEKIAVPDTRLKVR